MTNIFLILIIILNVQGKHEKIHEKFKNIRNEDKTWNEQVATVLIKIKLFSLILAKITPF